MLQSLRRQKTDWQGEEKSDTMKLEDIYNNRASIEKSNNHQDANDSECCEEELVFALEEK